jgi:hypothetical protein
MPALPRLRLVHNEILTTLKCRRGAAVLVDTVLGGRLGSDLAASLRCLRMTGICAHRTARVDV